MTEKINHIIVRYLTNSSTLNDLDTLTEWIKNPDNEQIFNDYVQTHYAINHNVHTEDSKEILENLLHTIRKEKSRSYRLKNKPVYKYAIAASILFLVSLSILFTQKNEPSHTGAPIIVNQTIKVGTDKATLTLDDGSEIALTKGSTYKVKNATSNGEQIVYKTTNNQKPTANTQIAFNYLTIPRGGQYQVTLSDNTKITLNSESQLKYPVSFTDGETRQVELVYGEAYFEVSSSTKHKGSTFNVVNNNQEIEVLGTEFNIKAYADEDAIYTTLVNGKIAWSANQHKQLLSPSDQLIFQKETNRYSLQKVEVYNEISWRDGIFSFVNKPLQEIMKTLARWYDFDVEFGKTELASKLFNGILSKDQHIEDILTTLKELNAINDFIIKDKKIVLV